MAGTFTKRKALKALAGAIATQMPYIAKASSLFSQSELKGKKYGMAVHGYLPDAGNVYDGIVATPSKAHEVEVTAYIKNKGTSVEVDLWDEFVYIEDFKKQIIDKRAGKLAREVQLAVMNENLFRSNQIAVATTAGLGLLGEAGAKLEELSVDGDKVCFQTPSVYDKIGEASLKNFLPSEIMKDIYEEKQLGTYHEVGQVQLAKLPILDTTGVDTAPTITMEVVKDASNNIIGLKPTSEITTSGAGSIKVGVPYKLSGLNIVDESGIETDMPYVIIVNTEKQYDVDGNPIDVTYIPEIRVTVPGKAYGNPNAVLSAAAISAVAVEDQTTHKFYATFTLGLADGIEAGEKYQIGQARTIKSLSFDQYRFDSLPAAKQDEVGTFQNFTVKMQSAPQLLNGVNCLRIDFPFCAKLWEPRQSVTTYLKIS